MKEETKEARRKVLGKPIRKGRINATRAGGINDPIAMKDCPACHKPCPWTMQGAFACKACNFLFH